MIRDIQKFLKSHPDYNEFRKQAPELDDTLKNLLNKKSFQSINEDEPQENKSRTD
jgi:flagellar basal body-associated protein FliL